MILSGKTYYDTPIGLVELVCSDRGMTHLAFNDQPTVEINPGHDHLIQCMEQLEEYFAGKRTQFTVFLDMVGTEFQMKVWHGLLDIPAGSTQTYSQLANKYFTSKHTRAVGDACGQNKLLILVPCHRVLASDGKLTGYAGGISRKRWLLDHEWGLFHGKQTQLF